MLETRCAMVTDITQCVKFACKQPSIELSRTNFTSIQLETIALLLGYPLVTVFSTLKSDELEYLSSSLLPSDEANDLSESR